MVPVPECISLFVIKVIYEDRRSGDPSILVANGNAAKDFLQLKNKYCSLRNIIKTL